MLKYTAIIILICCAISCTETQNLSTPPETERKSTSSFKPVFIESLGKLVVDQDRNIDFTVHLKEQNLEYAITYNKKDGSVGNGSSIALNQPNAPWFIYLETPEQYWVFNGSTELELHETKLGEQGSVHKASSFAKVPDYLKERMPEALKRRLPERFE